MAGEGAHARAVKSEGAHARPPKDESAPRVLCAGIIVLDNIVVPKDRIKSIFYAAECRLQSANMRLKVCQSCAKLPELMRGKG